MPDKVVPGFVNFGRYKMTDRDALKMKEQIQADEDREIFRILDGIIEAAYDWCVLIEEEVDA